MSGQEWKNKLYYGDNLDVMKHITDESIDLIYLDPPFKSDLDYNVLFRADGLSPDEAQWTAFKDTWLWDEGAERALAALQDTPNPRLVGFVNALAISMERSPMFAYVVNMSLRLLEMHKKLKATGSLYLHCDPTASHYLKLIMDSIFGPENFLAEITWKRTNIHSDAKRWSPVADMLLHFSKGSKPTWNPTYLPHSERHLSSKYRHIESDGRKYMLSDMTSPKPRPNMMYEWKGHASPPLGWRYSKETMARLDTEGRIWYPDSKSKRPRLKRYLDETLGVLLGNVWTDIAPINSRAQERLGYPTQKPEALLERIINASSNEGDLILDPFCGCGTTIAVAQRLKRRWIGIDISPFAIQLIQKKRLGGAFPDLKVGVNYEIDGLPTTKAGAILLAERDKKAFEIWAVAQLDGIPNEKRGADKGIDGRIPFKPDGKTSRFAVVSVKGGKLKADDVRSLAHVAKREKASSLGFGVFVTLQEPTKGMRADAAGAGTETINGCIYPLVQILTIEDILHGKYPRLPFIDKSVSLKDAPMAEIGTQDKLFS